MESLGQRPLKVGLLLTPWKEQAPGTVPRWTDVLMMAQRAEAVGFDSLWVPDHVLLRFPGTEMGGGWEGWSLLAALAAASEQIELGPLVTCTSFRNPALLAKMADTVDEISGGRLILGLGAGWHEPEFRALGLPFDHRISRFEEVFTIVRTLLREGAIDFVGTYYSARNCELRPRGPRRTGPPIMVGASGERMLQLAARHADVWNRDFASSAPEDLATWQARVDAACGKVGRDPGTLERTAAVVVTLPSAPRRVEGALGGPPEEIAEGLRAYARAGFTHVQLWLEPGTVEEIEVFGRVLEVLDRDSGVASPHAEPAQNADEKQHGA